LVGKTKRHKEKGSPLITKKSVEFGPWRQSIGQMHSYTGQRGGRGEKRGPYVTEGAVRKKEAIGERGRGEEGSGEVPAHEQKGTDHTGGQAQQKSHCPADKKLRKKGS